MKLRTRSTRSSNSDIIATQIICFDGMAWLAMIMRRERDQEEVAEILKVLALEKYESRCLVW